MKPAFAFDTSALISLGHTDLIDLIMKNCEIIISKRILEELKDIAKFDDLDAEAANKWLDLKSNLIVKDATESNIGEEELIEICNRENIPLITDDIQATKKLDETIEWFFSVHIVFLLYYKRIISEAHALFSIEKMIEERTWKNNIIAISGRMMFP